MSYWKCTKSVIMEGDIERGQYQAFTEGQIYRGQPSATPGGDWAMAFTNDWGDTNHLMTTEYLHEYFVEVPGPPPLTRSGLAHFADDWIEGREQACSRGIEH